MDPSWERFNVEAAPERLKRFAFDEKVDGMVGWFDYQTMLDGTYPGRHGAGRAVLYDGHYLKGIGLTPANANWNDPTERYHGTGHMSAGSAAREYLITQLLGADSIVACQTVLARDLNAAERRFIEKGTTSARAKLSAADRGVMAVSVKRGDFARMSNVVWALDHFATDPQLIGRLFLDFEKYLRDPADREDLEGSGDAIAIAIEGAFDRGLRNFERWRELGLFWIYTQNNFTLDGRWVDLETPTLVGSPFLGMMKRLEEPDKPEQFLGFEEFAFVWTWRMFLNWLDRKLSFLLLPGIFAERAIAFYLKDVRRALRKRFAKEHRIHANDWLMDWSRKGARQMGLGAKGRRQYEELMQWRMRAVFEAHSGAPPELGWEVDPGIVSGPFAGEVRVSRPSAMPGPESDCARTFQERVSRTDASASAADWLEGIKKETRASR